MAVLSIHHVSVVVADTRRALGFYCELLGLGVCEDRPEMGFPGAWLDIAGQQIHLLELPDPDESSVRPEHGGRDRHLAMSVDNLDEIEQALMARNMQYTKSRSGRAALFCRDPDGNAVELIQAQL